MENLNKGTEFSLEMGKSRDTSYCAKFITFLKTNVIQVFYLLPHWGPKLLENMYSTLLWIAQVNMILTDGNGFSYAQMATDLLQAINLVILSDSKK